MYIKQNGLTAQYRKEYEIFKAAERRCQPDNESHLDYWDRGIRFKFTSFQQFIDEVGARPNRHTIERINNDGHYEPGNVCWATQKAQAQNRRPPSWKNHVTDEALLEEVKRRGIHRYTFSPRHLHLLAHTRTSLEAAGYTCTEETSTMTQHHFVLHTLVATPPKRTPVKYTPPLERTCS